MARFIKRHWLMIISLLYLIWPLDLISEIFGPIGLIDDAALLLVALAREIYRYFKKDK
ncbi:MAG: YkvA family protein [Candidatus Dojkabacteria bacterium]